MTRGLTASARYTSDLPPERLLSALRADVEPHSGGFQFVSKLSGGGVVVRVLRAPVTDLGWFGTVDEERFSVAQVARDGSGTPFQPILRGEVRPRDGGSLLELELSAHPDARSFSFLFTVGGVLLGAASLIAMAQAPAMGLAGLGFAALFLVFPGLRARIGFAHACETSLAAFAQQLDLTPAP